LAGSNVDVVCVSETWFVDGSSDVPFVSKGCELFRSDMRNHLCNTKILSKHFQKNHTDLPDGFNKIANPYWEDSLEQSDFYCLLASG